MPLNSRDAAAVAGLGEAALRQRACRLRTDTALLGWALIRESASNVKLPHAGAGYTWVEPSPPPMVSHTKATFGPSVTLMLLRHLVAGRTPTEVAAGFMLETSDVQRLSDCAMNVIKSAAACIWVRREAASRSIPVDLAEALDHLEVDLSEADDDKFESLQIWLQDEKPSQLLEAAVRSWLACRSGLYLGLDVPREVIGLYRLLAASCIDPVLLRVCVRPGGSDSSGAGLKAIVERDFITAFGIKPRVIPAKPRSRVAQAYLQLDSDDTMDRHHARAGSLKGLDVLMLAVAVHLDWRKGVMS